MPVTNIANNQIRVFPDIALKSAGIMQFSDAPTYLGNIHEQNTDIGTDSQTFYIGENGPKLKNNSNLGSVRYCAYILFQLNYSDFFH